MRRTVVIALTAMLVLSALSALSIPTEGHATGTVATPFICRYRDVGYSDWDAITTGKNVWDYGGGRFILLRIDASDVPTGATLLFLNFTAWCTYKTATSGYLYLNKSKPFSGPSGYYTYTQAQLQALSDNFITGFGTTMFTEGAWTQMSVFCTAAITEQFETNKTIFLYFSGWGFGTTDVSIGLAPNMTITLSYYVPSPTSGSIIRPDGVSSYSSGAFVWFSSDIASADMAHIAVDDPQTGGNGITDVLQLSSGLNRYVNFTLQDVTWANNTTCLTVWFIARLLTSGNVQVYVKLSDGAGYLNASSVQVTSTSFSNHTIAFNDYLTNTSINDLQLEIGSVSMTTDLQITQIGVELTLEEGAPPPPPPPPPPPQPGPIVYLTSGHILFILGTIGLIGFIVTPVLYIRYKSTTGSRFGTAVEAFILMLFFFGLFIAAVMLA